MQDLLAAPRQDADRDELLEALSYATGGTLWHGVRVLTLGDVDTTRLLRFTSGEVSYAYRPPSRTSGQQAEGVTETRRTMSVEVVGALGENLSAVRLAPFTVLRLRSGRTAVFLHGVFEPTNPSVGDDGVVVRRTISCEDKSARWKTKVLPAPLSFTGTEQVVAWIKASMQAVFGETSFAIESSTSTLDGPRVFEAGISYLELYSRLLEAIGFDQLSPDELGRPASQSLATIAGRGVEGRYGKGRGKVLTAGTVSPLLPSLPNVLTFSARQGPSLGNEVGNGLTIRENVSTGPASLLARGGYRVEQTVEVDADTQAALEAVADAECQRYFAGGGLRFEGAVALNPLTGDRDVIELALPRLSITDGSWLVTSWKIPLQPVGSDASSVLMPITAERRVDLQPAVAA